MSTESDHSVGQVLHGCVSQETAYVAQGYPFGYTLKSPKRYWIETKKGHGQRLATDTAHKSYLPGYTDAVDRDAYYAATPPRVWNKPKCGNYYDMVIMYLDCTTGHCETAVASSYRGPEDLMAFAEKWQSQFDEEQAIRFAAIIKSSRRMNVRSWAEYDAKSEGK